MKKVIALVLATTFIMLCGCEKYSDYKEIESRLFVSALGIDETASGITLYVESAVSNNQADGYKVQVLTGTADTILEAFDNIKTATPLSLDLSHLAVIILGKRKDDTEKKLGEYLLSKPEDLLSCYLVSSDSAKELISCGNETPVGYSLSYALKKNDYAGGKRTPSTLLDVINSPYGFSLPYFKVVDKEYSYAGAVYYKGLERLTIKDTNEARLITLLSGDFLRGQITAGGKTFQIKKSDFCQSVKNSTLQITLSLDLTNKADLHILENELLRTLNEWKEDYRVNIFRFKDNAEIISGDDFYQKDIDFKVKSL